jgi:predicted nucleotidyltransferase
MKTREQILNFLAQNKQMFRARFHIVRIGLFGSYARGDQNSVSDLDLLVEFEDGTENLYELKLQIKDFFRSQLGLNVDICREKYIKPRFKDSILKETVYA